MWTIQHIKINLVFELSVAMTTLIYLSFDLQKTELVICNKFDIMYIHNTVLPY